MPYTHRKKQADYKSNQSTLRRHAKKSSNDKWFRTTLYSIGDAVITTDAVGKVLQMNPVAEKLTGWRESEAHGKLLSKVFKIVNEETRKEVRNPVQRVLREGIVIGLANHTILISKSGPEYPIADAAAPIKDTKKKVIGVVLVFRDQTAERNAQRAVQDARDFAESIIATIREPLLVLDDTLEVVSVNHSFLKTFQVTPEETVGRKVYELGNSQWNIPKLRSLLEEILPANSHFDDFEVTHTFEHIGRRTMVINARRMFRKENRSQLILLAIEDITQRKQTELLIQETEERFRRLADTTSTAIFIYQGEKFVYVNKATQTISGYTQEELLAKRFWDVVHPDHQELIRQRGLARQSGESVPERYEFKIVRSDGTERWIDFTTGKIDWQGEAAAIGSAFDITDRKIAEEKLQRSHAEYERFFLEDLTGDYIATPEGRIIACNPAFLRIFGFNSKEEALATTFASLFRSPEEYQKLLSPLLRRKKLDYCDLRMTKRDGSQLFLIGNLVGRFNQEGTLIEIQGYLFDDTKRHQLEEVLRQTQKLESIGTLASGIAHDFNNILGIVLGHASILESKQQEEDKIKISVKAITTASQRGASLVKQLLTFARKTTSIFEPLEITLIIKELAKMLYETFPRTIAIQLNLEPNLPPIIADATQMHQAVLNLCVNARDAMPKGGTLTIATEQIDVEQISKRFPNASAQRYVVLTVSDTGVGMDRQTLSRIFEPFFTTKAPGHGTGLGLAVVHGVIGAHNGYIDVESHPGKGSTFRVYLPAAEQPLFNYESAAAAATELPGGTETILIVEDENNLRQVLETYLTTRGYTVISAENGKQALELYRTHNKEIALIISDIGLPHLSGEEIFRRVKEINPKVKVILASGFVDPEEKSELLSRGVLDIIIKPYNLSDVLLTTRKILDTNP